MTSREDAHTCHAEGCEVHVPPKMFMCKRHWFMLPKALRDEVWRHYAVGQEMRMDPSPEYLNVAMRCVRFVAVKEGRIPIGDSHHDESVTRDRDQPTGQAIGPERAAP